MPSQIVPWDLLGTFTTLQRSWIKALSPLTKKNCVAASVPAWPVTVRPKRPFILTGLQATPALASRNMCFGGLCHLNLFDIPCYLHHIPWTSWSEKNHSNNQPLFNFWCYTLIYCILSLFLHWSSTTKSKGNSHVKSSHHGASALESWYWFNPPTEKQCQK